MNRALFVPALVLVLASGGCTGADPEAAPSAVAASLSTSDAASILDVVNYPGTDLDALDHAVGLDARAARGILAARNGADGVCPSADDAPFVSIEDLDAVPYVGDSAFGKLGAYALAHPAPQGEIVEGVAFAGWEAQAVVWGVDHAQPAELDALLDARAATALVAHRPYATVAQMGPQSYVGTAALGALRRAATGWWTSMRSGGASLAGTFDGVAFDDGTAHVALEIAGAASSAQLVAHGVTTTTAGHVIAGRPYATLAQVAAVTGVGTATMQALHGYAQSGTWAPPSSGGTCGFAADVQPHLGDLLFMSESDRPIDVATFSGAGASAPTAASVLALVGAPSGGTAQLRGVEDFYVAFEPNSSTSDPNAGNAVRAAVESELTDVVYVAVFAPPGSIDRAVVNVYLVGRTACGDLVGLHAVAIET